MPRQVSSTSAMCLYLIGFFIPPLAVAMTAGCGLADVLINICLWVLGWIPGVIHAWWLISKSEKMQRRTVMPAGQAYPARTY
ncbi:Proteolipid membrane potential modulator-domain containing protein [Rhodotorula toruloides]|uniref:Proteolipid membrane potential modulator-domain containing protein n=2 Tax=Rhodotorula toruloides TaxID=5286 RepID=A0A2T0A2C3_RHOTO|nr:Proteolipid membrane potential modulator-domain containing protein [Rhodotorula toruloides]